MKEYDEKSSIGNEVKEIWYDVDGIQLKKTAYDAVGTIKNLKEYDGDGNQIE